MRFQLVAPDELIVDDEKSFRHVALYGQLKEALRAANYRFRVPTHPIGWGTAVFLNLTFWEPGADGDVLMDRHVAADVLAHAAWHSIASRMLAGPGGKLSSRSSLLAESIASAFDIYLIGRLLGHATEADFLATQVPAMAETAEAGGMGAEAFEHLLERASESPELCFEELRELIYDASVALSACSDFESAAAALERFDGHPFYSLLHHFELSNWVLSARAMPFVAESDALAQATDAALRSDKGSAIEWLEQHWVHPLTHQPV